MMYSSPFNLFALIVISAWIPAILLMFLLMTPRRAVIASFVIGYLFLPELGIRFHTMPEINKAAVTSLGVLLGSLFFDPLRLFTIRPRLLDLAWVCMPLFSIASSITNGLGIMDGLSNFLELLLRWGFAYWIGRAYFTDWAAMRELAIGLILGGLAYAPLCWWEIRMSPQLHGVIYGSLFESFRSDNYLFGVQLFGFRPNVFLANGLSVTMFMGCSAVVAFWAWMSGSPRKLLGMPMGWIAFGLVVTTFFCKALGGTTLMLAGIGALCLVKYWPKTRIPALILIIAAPTYMFIRTNTSWSGDFLVNAASVVSRTRGNSLDFRLENEDLLIGKAMQRPAFGWGGWARSHVYDIDNRDLTIVDGLWILLLGEFGVMGLAAFSIVATGASLSVWRRVPKKFWDDPACAAVVAIAMVVAMYMVDSLFNATFSPLASLAVGATVTMAGLARTTFSQRQMRQAGFPVVATVSPSPARTPALVSSVKDLPYVYSPYRA
ncbi:MAG TPA: hypothetical protein VLJ39_05120 [Tepidisphaeraceae bacterium]|nr:hypothetical protein [Tepidisphaeraceae bacterium]